MATVAVVSLIRGGAWRAPPPPPPPSNNNVDGLPEPLRSMITAFLKLIGKGPPDPPPPPPPGPQIPIDALQPYYEIFMKINEPLRFFISGNLGNVIFYYVEKLMSIVLTSYDKLPANIREYQDSLSFFIAYELQVVPQHWLHALLVYGLDTINTREKYFKTLLPQYTAYLGSLIGSTLLNTLFIKVLQLNKTFAFIVTLWTFAVINYFVIGWIVRRGTETSSTSSAAVQIETKRNSKGNNSKKDEPAKKKVNWLSRGGHMDFRSCRLDDPTSLHAFVVSVSDPVRIDRY